MIKFIKVNERTTKKIVYVNGALIIEVFDTNYAGVFKATLYFIDGTTKHLEQSAVQVYRKLT